MGSYSQDGKAQTKGGGRNGKRVTSTVTEDQHGMTASSTSATETREVSQPLDTPGKNSVLSEPTRTLQSKQSNKPLRRKSNRNTTQLAQSKQLSSPKMNNNCHSNPDRKYYMPPDGAKTYYINNNNNNNLFTIQCTLIEHVDLSQVALILTLT